MCEGGRETHTGTETEGPRVSRLLPFLYCFAQTFVDTRPAPPPPASRGEEGTSGLITTCVGLGGWGWRGLCSCVEHTTWLSQGLKGGGGKGGGEGRGMREGAEWKVGYVTGKTRENAERPNFASIDKNEVTFFLRTVFVVVVVAVGFFCIFFVFLLCCCCCSQFFSFFLSVYFYHSFSRFFLFHFFFLLLPVFGGKVQSRKKNGCFEFVSPEAKPAHTTRGVCHATEKAPRLKPREQKKTKTCAQSFFLRGTLTSGDEPLQKGQAGRWRAGASMELLGWSMFRWWWWWWWWWWWGNFTKKIEDRQKCSPSLSAVLSHHIPSLD